MSAEAGRLRRFGFRRGKTTERGREERRLGWMLCAPAVIAMLAVTAYPIGYAIVLSFQDLDLRFPEEAFDAAACLSNPDSQLTATELDGLPPSNQTLYTDKVVKKAYPGFADLVKRSIDDAGPRPATPAYQDVSLAIQRSLHPPSSIDPDDVTSSYDALRSDLEDAVKREGLL